MRIIGLAQANPDELGMFLKDNVQIMPNNAQSITVQLLLLFNDERNIFATETTMVGDFCGPCTNDIGYVPGLLDDDVDEDRRLRETRRGHNVALWAQLMWTRIGTQIDRYRKAGTPFTDRQRRWSTHAKRCERRAGSIVTFSSGRIERIKLGHDQNNGINAFKADIDLKNTFWLINPSSR